ncbi:hypothetical protein FYK55_15040 [Roseiconus nitratireducens]|uniref:Aminotransferase class I/classII domain-containing protein n=1 Tax=Roseiconus nitratireducens TaxID=2605748 RepID=A0A5M6D773_9BACT|nr:hypothetical protein [Roseiconus nitratireducens]KAA5542122.1 hypothetical protein FYK55_15040 [Roseiconus nitratireducens]
MEAPSEEFMVSDPHQELNDQLSRASVSKIVYSLVMPETESVIDSVFDGEPGCQGREAFHDLFREAWTQKQDAVHESFFAVWKQWSELIVDFDAAEFPFVYPTGGASEAIREAIHAYGVDARRRADVPKIHVFDGEYEGFHAYADAAGIEVQSHNRRDWPRAVESMGNRDQFYLSQPSAIDGMVWENYEAFLGLMQDRRPEAQLMLDLTYVGCVGKEFRVNAGHPAVAAIFFSLSKPAGVYYHRVGGMWSRRAYPGLFGNKWFKNLTSLRIGTVFMQRHAAGELPRKYRPIQERVTREVNRQLDLSLEPADVMLLATGRPSSKHSPLQQFLLRGSEGERRVRVCLTPRMAHAIDPALTPTVSARAYERLDQ